MTNIILMLLILIILCIVLYSIWLLVDLFILSNIRIKKAKNEWIESKTKTIIRDNPGIEPSKAKELATKYV